MRNKEFRFHEKERVIKNRRDLMKMSKTLRNMSERMSDGELDKKDPIDCGHAKCQCCHIEKVSKKIKRKRRNSEHNIENQE